MAKIENDIEKHLIKQCKKLEIFQTKFAAPGTNGMPDRLLVKNGNTVFIELKKPKEKPRKLQLHMIKQLKKHGAIVFVVDNELTIDEITNTMAYKDTKELLFLQSILE